MKNNQMSLVVPVNSVVLSYNRLLFGSGNIGSFASIISAIDEKNAFVVVIDFKISFSLVHVD